MTHLYVLDFDVSHVDFQGDQENSNNHLICPFSRCVNMSQLSNSITIYSIYYSKFFPIIFMTTVMTTTPHYPIFLTDNSS